MVGMNAPCSKEGPLEKPAQGGEGGSWRAWLKALWPSGGPGVTQKRPSQAPCPRGGPHPPGPPLSVGASFGASSSPAPTPLPAGLAQNSTAELSFKHPDLPPAPQEPGGEWTPHLSEPMPCPGGAAQAAHHLPLSWRGHWLQSKGKLRDRPGRLGLLVPGRGSQGRCTWASAQHGSMVHSHGC